MTSYQDYTDTFKGSIISSESEFDNAVRRVNALLKSFTEGRIEEYSGEDKDTAIYVLCEQMFGNIKNTQAAAEHAGIASENTDGYSVSYAAGSARGYAADSQEFERELCRTAKMYLPAELFYRGV